jgi:hypothetical protein
MPEAATASAAMRIMTKRDHTYYKSANPIAEYVSVAACGIIGYALAQIVRSGGWRFLIGRY